MIYDLECPYCEAQNTVNHDDGQNYEEDVKHQMTCNNCDLNFIFFTQIYFIYLPYQSDCLNGKAHKYTPTHTWPRKYAKMECNDCGDIRNPTNKEKIKYNIQ